MGQARLNLRGVTTLIADRDQFTRGLVAQIIRGFGVETVTLVDTGQAAKAYLASNHVDLCIFEAILPDMESPELIAWIRRQDKNQLRFVPVIILSGYTQLRMVATARDAGSNLVIKKPVSPQALFDRIRWIARIPRPFIEAGGYVGPDRRFNNVTPPDGIYKRVTDTPADTRVEKEAAPPAANKLISALAKDLPG